MTRNYPHETILAVEPTIDETGTERPFGTGVGDPEPEYFAGNYGDWQGQRVFLGYFGFASEAARDAYLANPEVEEAPSGAFGILNRHVAENKTPAEWLTYFKG